MRKELILFTIIAVFSAPFFLIFKLISFIPALEDLSREKISLVVMMMFQICAVVIGAVFVKELSLTSFSLGYLYGFLTFIGSVVGLIAIVLITIALSEYFEKKRQFREPKGPSIFKVLYNSAKERLCSKISFVD